jgi:hypothetical protein
VVVRDSKVDLEVDQKCVGGVGVTMFMHGM